ncbi:MAG: fasciclin domain-containing protein [Bacteroidota bacterium]
MIYSIKRFGQLFVLLFLSLLLQNCAENDALDTATNPTEETATAFISMDNATVVESFEDGEVAPRTNSFYTFNTLNQALHCTGLGAVLGHGLNTIYAPSDAAFAKLGLNAHNVCHELSPATLKEILLYHVVTDELVDLREVGCQEMANGDLTQRSIAQHRFFINESNIYRAFTQVGHTYKLRVYVIPDVLEVPNDNIVETASEASIFESLVAAVLAADPAIAAALSDDDAIFTVFAPTNAAFHDLIAAFGASSLNELVHIVGVETLSTILLYHVVDACAFSNDLRDGLRLTTLQGEKVEIDLHNLQVIDKTDTPAGLEVDLLDIRTDNGVVHGIDKVLLPQEVLNDL